jgi:hypothetical protein
MVLIATKVTAGASIADMIATNDGETLTHINIITQGVATGTSLLAVNPVTAPFTILAGMAALATGSVVLLNDFRTDESIQKDIGDGITLFGDIGIILGAFAGLTGNEPVVLGLEIAGDALTLAGIAANHLDSKTNRTTLENLEFLVNPVVSLIKSIDQDIGDALSRFAKSLEDLADPLVKEAKTEAQNAFNALVDEVSSFAASQPVPTVHTAVLAADDAVLKGGRNLPASDEEPVNLDGLGAGDLDATSFGGREAQVGPADFGTATIEQLYAAGDNDTIISGESVSKSVLFAFGNDDTLIATGQNDVLVGQETTSKQLRQERDYTSLSEVLIAGSGDDTIYSSLNAYQGHGGEATLGPIPVNETIIGGTGNDTIYAFLDAGTDNVTIEGGKGNNQYFYAVPIINNPQKQGIVRVFTGNGNDIVGGIGPAEIDLGNGSDVVLPGFGSVVNAGQGQDVIGVANDVQLNGLKANDRISMFGIYDLTGGIQWAGLESPFAYGADGTRYGLNQNGDLVIEDVFGDTLFVSNYHGGPGVPANQETAGIFIAQDSVSASFLLNPLLPLGWLWGQMAFVNSLSKAYDGPNFGIYGGVDPLVFDLAGNGIDLTAASSTAPVFDMNGNGFAVHTGWVEPGSGDGILVLDRDGASQITNIDQLIGGEASAGGVSAIGFAQLAQYDSNLDGVINASDPIYSQLRIWVDSDGAGTGELLTLQQAGIASINLADTAQTGDLVSGDQILATSTFTRADGSTGEVADVSFQTDNFNTTFTGSTSVSTAAAALPDLKGYGTLTDLQVAMTNDPALADPALGPSLMSVVEATVPTLTSLDLPTLRDDITPILTAWANAVEGVDDNGNPLPITTESHADVPILVSTDSTGAMTVVDFAYEVTDSLGSYWALASGDAVLDANGNPIARPTLAQVEAQAPAGDGWTTFSGAQLDFMERYTGDPIPLGTGAPLDPGAALQDAIPTIQVLWQTLNQLAVALAMQGPLAPYFQGLVYDASDNQFEPTDPGQQLTPMYEAIFAAAPQTAASLGRHLDNIRARSYRGDDFPTVGAEGDRTVPVPARRHVRRLTGYNIPEAQASAALGARDIAAVRHPLKAVEVVVGQTAEQAAVLGLPDAHRAAPSRAYHEKTNGEIGAVRTVGEGVPFRQLFALIGADAAEDRKRPLLRRCRRQPLLARLRPLLTQRRTSAKAKRSRRRRAESRVLYSRGSAIVSRS